MKPHEIYNICLEDKCYSPGFNPLKGAVPMPKALPTQAFRRARTALGLPACICLSLRCLTRKFLGRADALALMAV